MATTAAAKSISITIEQQAEMRGDTLVAKTRVNNGGDEAAKSLVVTIRFGDEVVRGTLRDALEPGATLEEELVLATGALANGRWPYAIAVDYTDAHLYAFQALHVATVDVGSAPAPPNVSVELTPDTKIAGSGALGIRFKNLAGTARELRYRIIVPEGLAAPEPTGKVELAGSGDVSTEVAIEKRSALSGSRYPVFVAVEYDDGGTHQGVVAQGMVDVVEPRDVWQENQTLVLVAALGVLAAWITLVSLRRKTTIDESPRIVRSLCDATAVGAAAYMIAGNFPAEVMFSETIATGGDMGSHYYAALYLRDVLLPKGQVTGWCPGNYGGFPLFQYYFFLPFLVIVGLSYLVPLTIAFKIGTVLGVFLLPACAYGAFRLARAPFPAPALAALATLPFLFMEANSVWGGNLPSTLAGEFAFSHGLALAVLFMGVLRRVIDTRRGYAWAGLFVAAIGMMHGYTLLWAGLFSTWELVTLREWWRRMGALTAIHGLAILLMAFWLIPLFAYAPWTTPYAEVWNVKGWQEILPPILWIPAGVAVATLVVHVALAARGVRPFPRLLGLVWWATAIAVALSATATTFHVVDIRFYPFLQLGLCLAAAGGLGHLLAMLPAPAAWPVLAALVVPLAVGKQVTFIPSWIRWNYAGYEQKPAHPILAAISEKLRGSVGDSRVVFEHSDEHNALGTIRTFENLPLFTGRPTLEGVYMQGSPSAPFVFYIQSEISEKQSCPFPNWGCSRRSLERGVPHLEMFNVGEYIVRADSTKEEAARHPGLELESSIGAYQIWRVKQNAGRYAIPLDSKPVLVRSPSWKETSFQWFKTATPESVLPVFTVDPVEPGEAAQFAAVSDGMPAELPEVPLGQSPILREVVENDRITITGTKPGHPVLVRLSYHPRWQALTGERIWIAGPAFMLVFPKGDQVVLAYGDTTLVKVASLLTLVGWALFFASAIPPLRRRVVAARDWMLELPGFASLGSAVRWTGTWSPAIRGALLTIALLAAASVFAAAAVAARGLDANGAYRAGLERLKARDFAQAIPYFQQAQALAPLSNTAIHSTFYEAMSYYRQEDCENAERVFQRLFDRFPEAGATAQSLYHVGMCRRRRGDVLGAIAVWQEAQRRFPSTPWGRNAAQRLVQQRPR